MLSTRIPLQSLIELCRVLRHSLGAGMTLVTVFRQQAERGSAGVRPLAQRITQALQRGDRLQDALAHESARFPPLFLALAKVGEETGHLPEMFGELEKYYRTQHLLHRRLRAQTLLPIVQFVLAVFVVAVLICVLGILAESRGQPAPSVFGLRGAGGALVFLAIHLGILVLVLVGLAVLARLQLKRWLDALLLRVPVLGPCLEALALARFALALRLTLETGMPIAHALRLSLEATGNAAFLAVTDDVLRSVRAGDDLTTALSKRGRFPFTFLQMVAVAEEGGRVPDMMQHQAAYYHEEAGRRLKGLFRTASFVIWLIYAVFMVIMILRLAGIAFGALG